MRYSEIIPSPAELGDGFKYAIGGSLLGSLAAGVSSALSDRVIHYAGLDEGESSPSVAGRVVVRAAVAVPLFLMADRLLRGMGRRGSDPTDGVFFTAAFILPQVTSLLPVAKMVRDRTSTLIGGDCCASCANGGSCSAKTE